LTINNSKSRNYI